MTHKPKRLFQFPWKSSRRIASDVDAELEFHLATRVNDLIAQGLDPDSADQRARSEFGDVEFTRKYCRELDRRAQRETRLADRVAAFRQDVHYAWRTLRRSPGFTAVSLLTLALAIGATTAIVSVAHRVLLKPLPYGNPGELVKVYSQPQDDPARPLLADTPAVRGRDVYVKCAAEKFISEKRGALQPLRTRGCLIVKVTAVRLLVALVQQDLDGKARYVL